MTEPGRRLGKYDRLAEIGRGATGIIYRARDTATGRTIALKVVALSRLAAGNDAALDRFRRDSRMAARLSHPNIAAVLASGEHAGTAFMAMDWVDARPLDRILAEDGGLTVTRSLSILRQLLSALDHAHRAGLVHGTLEPADVLVDAGGTVTVTGFGGAAIAAPTAGVADDLNAAGAVLARLLDGHSLPPAVAALLAGAPAGQRFATAAAFAKAVGEALAPPAPLRRKSLPSIAALATVALASAAAGAVWYGYGDRSAIVPPPSAKPEPAAVLPLPAPSDPPATMQPPPQEPAPQEPAPQEPTPDRQASDPEVGPPEATTPPDPVPTGPSPAEPNTTEPNLFELPPELHPSEAPPDEAPPAIEPSPVIEPPTEPPIDPPIESLPSSNDAAAEPEPLTAPLGTIAEPAALRAELQAIRCAILDVVERDGRLLVTGTATSESIRPQIQALLVQHAGNQPHGTELRIASPYLCDPLALVEPLRAANAAAPAPLSIHLLPTDATLRGGEDLVVELAAPDFPIHVQVDYYTADGNVVHLLPNPLETSGRIEGGARRRLGDRSAGGRFWTAGPPFGNELIVVVAGAAPLFAVPRPEIEPAGSYLPDLKRALADAGAPALAAARFITTQPP